MRAGHGVGGLSPGNELRGVNLGTASRGNRSDGVMTGREQMDPLLIFPVMAKGKQGA
jgi:hypothetical protein